VFVKNKEGLSLKWYANLDRYCTQSCHVTWLKISTAQA